MSTGFWHAQEMEVGGGSGCQKKYEFQHYQISLSATFERQYMGTLIVFFVFF